MMSSFSLSRVNVNASQLLHQPGKNIESDFFNNTHLTTWVAIGYVRVKSCPLGVRCRRRRPRCCRCRPRGCSCRPRGCRCRPRCYLACAGCERVAIIVVPFERKGWRDSETLAKILYRMLLKKYCATWPRNTTVNFVRLKLRSVWTDSVCLHDCQEWTEMFFYKTVWALLSRSTLAEIKHTIMHMRMEDAFRVKGEGAHANWAVNLEGFEKNTNW